MSAVCVICTELLKEGNSISAAPCGHVYHSNCLELVNHNSAICPQCGLRTNLRSVRKLNFNFSPKCPQNSPDLENEIDKLRAEKSVKEDELKACKREKENISKDTEIIIDAMEEYNSNLVNEISRLQKEVEQNEKLLRELAQTLLVIQETLLINMVEMQYIFKDIENILQNMFNIID